MARTRQRDEQCRYPEMSAKTAYSYGCGCDRCYGWRKEQYQNYDKPNAVPLSDAMRRHKKRKAAKRG